MNKDAKDYMSPIDEGTRYRFEKFLGSHDRVRTLTRVSDHEYEIERITGDTIKIYVIDIYAMGRVDYDQIVYNTNDIDCIVNIRFWNYVVDPLFDDRKKKKVIRCFRSRDFAGALNWKKFWEYAPKDDS